MRQIKNDKKLVISVVLMLFSIATYFMAKAFPGFAQWHYQYIYLAAMNMIARITSLYPFSLLELISIFLIAAVIGYFVAALVKWKRRTTTFKAICKNGLANLFLFIAVIFFLYTENCGINYYRKDFAATAGITTDNLNQSLLIDVCRHIVTQLNELESQVSLDENGNLNISRSDYQEGIQAMKKLGNVYGDLEGYYPNPKPLIFSEFMSYQFLCGMYSPFTFEATFNEDMPDFNIPFTICHELSHLRGFMKEDEANFISFLACIGSDSPEFRYSGYLLAYIYCMNDLLEYNKEAYQEIKAERCQLVIRDLEQDRMFWDNFRGKVAEISSTTNDLYLKMNSEEDGVESYNRVVELILGYYNKNVDLYK
ncbi:DUF3810 domain-containing protein [Anaeromicropila populeti]|uniref:DUF3810 domain-containing protein n=1 Tax=Anaeromicropila populeti TaxID=37658 RepID=A0A1I6JWC8_9FIRM|nr:DUF3810 domain-containing protein [Anaeromicropila populeti]SFR83267.1 Protein of unknown function [Anaeromicropila populeti]